jgi:hypothetical protein
MQSATFKPRCIDLRHICVVIVQTKVYPCRFPDLHDGFMNWTLYVWAAPCRFELAYLGCAANEF